MVTLRSTSSDDLTVRELVTEGTHLAKSYMDLHRRSTHLVKSLALVIVKLRAKYEDRNGRPDLRGRSQAYRDAVAQIYRDAGIPPDATSNLQAAVRHHISTALREYMTEHGYTAEDYQYYKLHPDSMAMRNRLKEQHGRAAMAAARPEGQAESPENMLHAAERAVRDLGLLGKGESGAGLTPSEHEQLRESLDALDQYIAKIRASM